MFKLINTAQNRAFLRTVPHIDFLDLSIVFYVLLEITDEGTASMAVTLEHAEQWGVSAEQLWEDAGENVKRLLPAEFFTMNYVRPRRICSEMIRMSGTGCMFCQTR